MRRILPILLLLLLPALPARAQSPLVARVTQVDPSAYPQVTLYVSVTGANGRPVPGLNAGDFAVTEDGAPVEVSDFSGGGAGPVSAVLVIDRSGSMGEEGKLRGARDAAEAFVAQMRPGDRTALIAFDDRPELIQPFTGDRDLLLKALRRLDAGASTALYDSLIAGVDALDGATGRRALLLLTDGRDCRRLPCIDDPASRATLDQAIAHATRAGISVQAIGLGRRGSDSADGIDEQVLRRMAEATGGDYIYTPSASQLAELYRRLAADLHQEYRLTYRSPRPFYDGTRRDIRVSVGGAPAASGAYVERHLINVHSDPLVGVLLLLPILGALAWPLLRRPPIPGPVSALQPELAPAGASQLVASGAAEGATIVEPPSVTVLPPDLPRCHACDAPLKRPGARFCSSCGATVRSFEF